MTDTFPYKLADRRDRAALLHDLRHALLAIQLVPLLLEKHREDKIRFREICEELSRECEFIATLVEAEFADSDELDKGEAPVSTEMKGGPRDGNH